MIGMKLTGFGINRWNSIGMRIVSYIVFSILLIALSIFSYGHAFYPPQGPIDSCTGSADASPECLAQYPSYGAGAYCFNCGGGPGCYQACEATSSNHESACDTGGGTKRRCYDVCDSNGVAVDDDKCSGFCTPGSTATSQTDLNRCNDISPGTCVVSGEGFGTQAYYCGTGSESCRYRGCGTDGWYDTGTSGNPCGGSFITLQTRRDPANDCKMQKLQEARNYRCDGSCQCSIETSQGESGYQWFFKNNMEDGSGCRRPDGSDGVCESANCVIPTTLGLTTSTACASTDTQNIQAGWYDLNAGCYKAQLKQGGLTIQLVDVPGNQQHIVFQTVPISGTYAVGVTAYTGSDCSTGAFKAQEKGVTSAVCTQCSSFELQDACPQDGFGSLVCAWCPSPTDSTLRCRNLDQCVACPATPATTGQDCAPAGCTPRCASGLVCGTDNKCKVSLLPCPGPNGCTTEGDTRCFAGTQQTCGDHGRSCLEWGGDRGCVNACKNTKVCDDTAPDSCSAGCKPHCRLTTSPTPLNIRSGNFGGAGTCQPKYCESASGRSFVCGNYCYYGAVKTCEDFNSCTTNLCTPDACVYQNVPDGTSCFFSQSVKISDGNILPAANKNLYPGTGINYPGAAIYPYEGMVITASNPGETIIVSKYVDQQSPDTEISTPPVCNGFGLTKLVYPPDSPSYQYLPNEIIKIKPLVEWYGISKVKIYQYAYPKPIAPALPTDLKSLAENWEFVGEVNRIPVFECLRREGGECVEHSTNIVGYEFDPASQEVRWQTPSHAGEYYLGMELYGEDDVKTASWNTGNVNKCSQPVEIKGLTKAELMGGATGSNACQNNQPVYPKNIVALRKGSDVIVQWDVENSNGIVEGPAQLNQQDSATAYISAQEGFTPSSSPYVIRLRPDSSSTVDYYQVYGSHFYRVAAFNSGGVSTTSGQGSVQKSLNVPCSGAFFNPPDIKEFSVSGSTFTWKFNANSNYKADGWLFYRSEGSVINVPHSEVLIEDVAGDANYDRATWTMPTVISGSYRLNSYVVHCNGQFYYGNILPPHILPPVTVSGSSTPPAIFAINTPSEVSASLAAGNVNPATIRWTDVNNNEAGFYIYKSVEPLDPAKSSDGIVDSKYRMAYFPDLPTGKNYIAVKTQNSCGQGWSNYVEVDIPADINPGPPKTYVESVGIDRVAPWVDLKARGDSTTRSTSITIKGDEKMTCRWYDEDVAYDDSAGTPCGTLSISQSCVVPVEFGPGIPSRYTKHVACKDGGGGQSANQNLDVTWDVMDGTPLISTVLIKPDGSFSTTAKFDAGAIDLPLPTGSTSLPGKVNGPTAAYSKSDDSFLVVWGVVLNYEVLESVTTTSRSCVDDGPCSLVQVTENKNIPYAAYAIYSKKVKDRVEGEKKLVFLGTIDHPPDTVLYGPTVAYSSKTDRYMISWITVNAVDVPCKMEIDRSCVSFSCGQYVAAATLQGAVTDGQGNLIKNIAFDSHSSYGFGGGDVCNQYNLFDGQQPRGPPQIVATDDDKFLVMWTRQNNAWSSDAYKAIILSHDAIGYLTTSEGGTLGAGIQKIYERTFDNLLFRAQTSRDGRSQAALDTTYVPKQSVIYSPFHKEFVIGTVVDAIGMHTHSSGRNHLHPAYTIDVERLNPATGEKTTSTPYASDDQYRWGEPQSARLFETKDNEILAMWVEDDDTLGEIPIHRYIVIGKPSLISNGQPTGTVTSNAFTMSVQTNKPATCRYAVDTNPVFEQMTLTFDTTDNRTHSKPMELQDGSYAIRVRCVDGKGNVNLASYEIRFTVADSNPPVVKSSFPTGTISGSEVFLRILTNKPATCRYATTPGVSYDSMTRTFSTTASIVNSATISGLSSGANNFYVKCADTAGRKNLQDYTVLLTVQPAWYMFTTSSAYTGRLAECVEDSSGVVTCTSGLERADIHCQSSARSLGGTWKAWLSDSTNDAASDLVHGTGPYRLLNQEIIASDWNDLTNGQLLVSHIGFDQSGQAVLGSVWTNTKTDGTKNTLSCSNWFSDSSVNKGSYGLVNSGTSSAWTSSGDQTCNNGARLYCLSQAPMIIGNAAKQPFIYGWTVADGVEEITLDDGSTLTVQTKNHYIQTDIQAMCKFSATPGVPFDSMTGRFSVTNSTTHRMSASGTYYVKCASLADTGNCIARNDNDDCVRYYQVVSNKNTEDYAISSTLLPSPPPANRPGTLHYGRWQGNDLFSVGYSKERNELALLVVSRYDSSGDERSYHYSIPKRELVVQSLDINSRQTLDFPGNIQANKYFLVMAGDATRILSEGKSTYMTEFKDLSCIGGYCGGSGLGGKIIFTRLGYGGTANKLDLNWVLVARNNPMDVTCYLNCNPDTGACSDAPQCSTTQLPGRGSCTVPNPAYEKENTVTCIANYQQNPSVKGTISRSFKLVNFALSGPGSITPRLGHPVNVKIQISNNGVIADVYNVTFAMDNQAGATISPVSRKQTADTTIPFSVPEIISQTLSNLVMRTGEVPGDKSVLAEGDVTAFVNTPNALRVTVTSSLDPEESKTLNIPLSASDVYLPEFNLAGFLQIMALAGVLYFLYANKTSFNFFKIKKGKRRK